MRPEYYWGQAKQERSRLDGHQRKLDKATGELNKAESARSAAETAARKASSDSQARSKLRQAEREGKKADKARGDQTKASKAVTDSAAKVRKYEGQARDAQTKQDKRDSDAAAKAELDRKREADRVSRRQTEREQSVDQSIQHLGARTAEIERRLAAARRAAPETITVLFVAGTIVTGDKDDQPLRIDREIKEIEQKLRASTYRDQVKFHAHQATQNADLIDLLNQHDPDIVHFSGHGNRSSLLFEGPDGQPQPLRSDQLGLFLQVVRKPIQLVVFNACLSADQAEAATEHVSAAIGMDETIRDDSAKTFAGQFYRSLAEGNSLQNSFEQAQAQAKVVNDDPASGMSMLFAKPGVDPETLVLVAPPN